MVEFTFDEKLNWSAGGCTSKESKDKSRCHSTNGTFSRGRLHHFDYGFNYNFGIPVAAHDAPAAAAAAAGAPDAEALSTRRSESSATRRNESGATIRTVQVESGRVW